MPAAAKGRPLRNFDYSGPLTETVLLGTIAIRNPRETLQWDAAAMKITNSTAANAMLTKPYRKRLGSEVVLKPRESHATIHFTP